MQTQKQPWEIVNSLCAGSSASALRPGNLKINPNDPKGKTPKKDARGKKQVGFSLWIQSAWGTSRRFKLCGVKAPFAPTPSVSLPNTLAPGDAVPQDLFKHYTKLSVRGRLDRAAHAAEIAALSALDDRFLQLFFDHRAVLGSKVSGAPDVEAVKFAWKKRFTYDLGSDTEVGFNFKIKGWGDTVKDAVCKEWEKDGDSGLLVDHCDYEPRLKTYRPPKDAGRDKPQRPTKFLIKLPSGALLHEVALEEDRDALAVGFVPRTRLVGPQDLLPGCVFDVEIDPEGFDFGNGISTILTALVITITAPGVKVAHPPAGGSATEGSEPADGAAGAGAGHAADDDDSYWGAAGEPEALPPVASAALATEAAAFLRGATGGGASSSGSSSIPLPVFHLHSLPPAVSAATETAVAAIAAADAAAGAGSKRRRAPPPAAAKRHGDSSSDSDSTSDSDSDVPPPQSPPHARNKSKDKKSRHHHAKTDEERRGLIDLVRSPGFVDRH